MRESSERDESPTAAGTFDRATDRPAVRLRGVSKTFGSVAAVDHVDLDIAPGEFFSMLGPSGSGKTTMLRLIAGFELPTAGQILLDGVDVTSRPPFARDVNTVFQDYALFPHMTVAKNIEYGLRVRKVPRAERTGRVEQALETVRLAGFGDRKPHQLSGGQRQRVALARAIVNQPKVLLLDEPLGALDLKLREEMQVELKAIQQRLGITFVFVTHDQGEALAMSDRVAVFHQGRIEQVGTPVEIYERPTTPFVAGFVGTSNVLRGELAVRLTGHDAAVTVRPERIRLLAEGETDADAVAADATVVSVQYLGAVTRTQVRLDDATVLTLDHHASAGNDTRPVAGTRVRVAMRATDAHVLEVPNTFA